MIPKRIQIHWFFDYLPHWVDSAIQEYQKMFPTWEIAVYREIPDDMPRQYREVMDEAPHSRYCADLVRWWLLYRDGGIYVDADTLPRKDFSPLLKYQCFFPRLGGGRKLDIFFVGAEPGLQLFIDALEGCRNFKSGPHPGTYFYIENVLPEVSTRREVTVLDKDDAWEIKGYRTYDFLERFDATVCTFPSRPYIIHFCNFRARTRPLRQSLLDEQVDPEYLIRRYGDPEPYPQRPPEPKPQDIAWRKMPNGDLVVDPGGIIPEAPEGYVQDSEQPHRFHPIRR